MRKWIVCGGGNQRDGKVKEQTLNGEKRSLKAHRQIAVAKVRSPEATVRSCSPLNASKWLRGMHQMSPCPPKQY